jgi:hypothetical protein
MVGLLISGILIVGGSVLISLAGMLLVRRWVPQPILREHNEVAGFLIAVVGVAYAVLLVFMVIAVWERFEAAGATVQREAGALSNLYRIAEGLPEPTRHDVLQAAQNYGQDVVKEEWPLMDRGESSPHAWELADSLWRTVREADSGDSREQILCEQMIVQMADMSTQRKLRLLASHEGLHPLLWVAIWGGAAITVLFTYFFGVKSVRAQALMTAGMAGILALNIFVIAAIDYPFRGVVRVTPEAFQLVLERFEHTANHPTGPR